ncbi:M23 family metallopeptidase [Candidatus Collierbacteria bacterium]|nr:M23 family metallopeptidase [Candidatus Collierbacteria bacterium]
MPPASANQLELYGSLKQIILSGVTYDQLTSKERELLAQYALLYQLDSDIEAFRELQIIVKAEEEAAASSVDGALLAQLVQEMKEDKEAVEKEIATKTSHLSRDQQDLIKQLLEQYRLNQTLKQLNPEEIAAVSQIKQDVSPKEDPLKDTNTFAQEIVKKNLSETNTNFSPPQIEHAAAILSTAIASQVCDPQNKTSVAIATEVSLSEANLTYQNPITILYHQIETRSETTLAPSFDPVTTTDTLPFDPSSLSLPSPQVIEDVLAPTIHIQEQPNVADKAEAVKAQISKITESFSLHPQAVELAKARIPVINEEQKNLLVHAINADLPQILTAAPTQTGSTVATVIRKLNPVNPHLDPTAAEIYSMGLTSSQLAEVYKHAKEHPQSHVAAFIDQNPQTFNRLHQQISRLDKFPLSKDLISSWVSKPSSTSSSVAPPAGGGGQPLSGLAHRFQTLTNWVSGRLPEPVGRIFNFVSHPFQAIKSQIGEFIGNRIVGRLKSYIGEKIVSKIANETLKKTAQFLLKNGLKEGLKLLTKEGLKRGLQLAAQAANVAPGLGLVLAAAIEVGAFVFEKTFGLLKNTLNNFWRALTGDDFDWKVAASMPFALLLSIGGALGGIGTASVAAAASAGSTLIISLVIGIFFYLTAFTIAPLISTIAQLESGIGSVGTAGSFIGNPALPPGVLPDSCPGGLPTQTSFGITQGPRGGTHNSGWRVLVGGEGFTAEGEAMDYGTPPGTAVIATHNGQAYYFAAGTNYPDGYGNYVAIISTCQGRKILTTYAHLSGGNIPSGGPTPVTKGQVVGFSGNSGTNTTGPHLHYEIFGLGDIRRYL